jgi:hypothetical protein
MRSSSSSASNRSRANRPAARIRSAVAIRSRRRASRITFSKATSPIESNTCSIVRPLSDKIHLVVALLVAQQQKCRPCVGVILVETGDMTGPSDASNELAFSQVREQFGRSKAASR